MPPHLMVKPVSVEGFQGHWLMAVVPAPRQVNPNKVMRLPKRHWRLVYESGVCRRFNDCTLDAIAPVGTTFEMDTLNDQSLTGLKDMYFESGDHDGLLHMRSEQFLPLMPTAQCEPFSA